ncbi:MAG: hypothetical protein ABEK02_08885 [Haloquadratum sp.]
MSSNMTPDAGRSDGSTDAARDADDAETAEAVCPFCGSSDTELESTFGTEISKSQYYCNGCHTVFERIKYDGAMPETGRDRDGSR